MDNNMKEVFDALTKTVQLCRGYECIRSIEPKTVEDPFGNIVEIAGITYTDGYQATVDITGDSGMGAVMDVSRYLAFH